MTKHHPKIQEFLERWGYQPAIGQGSALFDCKKELLKDLEEIINEIVDEDNVYCKCFTITETENGLCCVCKKYKKPSTL